MMFTKRDGLESVYRTGQSHERRNFLRLDMNENPEGLPANFIRNVFESITPSDIAMYPETQRLTKKLADYLGEPGGTVIIGNGSDDIIKSIFEVYGLPGSNIVSVYPTFEMYAVYAKIFNMKHKALNFSEHWTVDANDLLALIDDQTSIVAVLNPNNPIGIVSEESDVIKLIDRANQVGAVVIIDEAYHYFYDKTFLNLVRQYSNVILTRTFSKLCSIAGLRIGFAVTSTSIVEDLNKVRATYPVNCVALRFAEAIIDDKDLIPALVKTEREGRNYLLEALAANGFEYFARNGNYVFIQCANSVDVQQRMFDKGILVKTYTHPLLKGHIRVTTGSESTMRVFFDQFLKVVRERELL